MQLETVRSGDLIQLHEGILVTVEEIRPVNGDETMTLRLAPISGGTPWWTAPMQATARLRASWPGGRAPLRH